MARSRRHDDFIRLREEFPFFAFEKQEFVLSDRGLDIRYTFNLADKYEFHPTLFIPRRTGFLPDEKITDGLDLLVFHIGMVELISYWKAACPPRLIIRPFFLAPLQIKWWVNLYFHGLGEFFYLNTINVTEDNFMIPEVASTRVLERVQISYNKEILIPVGGGKDSAITLKLLGPLQGSLPLMMNPGRAGIESIVAAGFAPDHFFEIRRTIDPLLIELNTKGFLNGHTPFSALLAFVALLSAHLSGKGNIALSNEASASEPTIPGTRINHQYSKSLEFENRFRTYTRDWISHDINYFSFLRPLSELQIASLFAKYERFHPVFRSCNAGSKTGQWCGACSKCLFTAIMLSPFLDQESVVRIFGKDLLNDMTLAPLLDQLSGRADEKPFECIGTIGEVNLALANLLFQFGDRPLPALLEYYKEKDNVIPVPTAGLLASLKVLPDEHNLRPEYLKILSDEFA